MKKIKILDLVPLIYTESIKGLIEDRKILNGELAERTNSLVQLDIAMLDKGSSSLENMYDEIYSAPYILKKVKWAEKDGYDAVVIDCLFDPVLEIARDIVSIPIVGPAQSACYLAAQIATKFSIITPPADKSAQRIVFSNIKKFGLIPQLASVRVMGLRLFEFEENPEKTLELIIKEAKNAIMEDKAEAIILGCTGMSKFAKHLKEEINRSGLEAPVIEPLRAAVYNALYMVLYGISHSKLAFPYPGEKLRKVDWENI